MPRMHADELIHHSEALAGLLMFPSLSASNSKKLMADIAELCECLRAYATYLRKHNDKQQEVHASSQPLRDPAVDSVAMVIDASELTPPYANYSCTWTQSLIMIQFASTTSVLLIVFCVELTLASCLFL